MKRSGLKCASLAVVPRVWLSLAVTLVVQCGRSTAHSYRQDTPEVNEKSGSRVASPDDKTSAALERAIRGHWSVMVKEEHGPRRIDLSLNKDRTFSFVDFLFTGFAPLDFGSGHWDISSGVVSLRIDRTRKLPIPQLVIAHEPITGDNEKNFAIVLIPADQMPDIRQGKIDCYNCLWKSGRIFEDPFKPEVAKRAIQMLVDK